MRQECFIILPCELGLEGEDVRVFAPCDGIEEGAQIIVKVEKKHLVRTGNWDTRIPRRLLQLKQESCPHPEWGKGEMKAE